MNTIANILLTLYIVYKLDIVMNIAEILLS